MADTREEVNLQHPNHTSMQLRINAFKIRKGRLPAQDQFVEAWYEIGIQKVAMEYSKSHDPADELEVGQVLWVDAR